MVKKKEIKEFNKYIQGTLEIFKGLGDNLAFIQGQHDLTFKLSQLSIAQTFQVLREIDHHPNNLYLCVVSFNWLEYLGTN